MTTFRLGAKAQRARYRLAGYDSVGSTNSEAAAAAAGGDPGNIWFVALQQTAGRGRRGRPWESPYGNLAASLLLRPDADPNVAATLGFVAGVAVHRALTELLSVTQASEIVEGPDSSDEAVSIALKWPNDVLVGGAKLVGILLEASAAPGGGQMITIGFGVNVAAAPQGLPYPTASLAEFGASFDAQQVFETLAEHWVDVYKIWDNGKGLADILAMWRQSAAGIGADIVVTTHDEIVRGTFESIDDVGRLIVKVSDGRRKIITAGDVHFGTTATLRN